MAEEKKKVHKKHKVLKIVLISLAVIIIVPVAYIGITTGMAQLKGDRTDKNASIDNASGLVQQKGASLYDESGKRLVLQGVNVGGMLVSEGWMEPYSVGETLNEDGSIKYDSDNLPTYPNLPMEDAYSGFLSNPNLNAAQRTTLISTFRSNWFSESDFKVVKEKLGYNAIRLPFYWRDILNKDGETFSRKDPSEAFTYFNWFLSQCKENGLYCILDLHGAPGSQNGYEHSGYTKGADLWTDDNNISATVDLWSYIADYYTNIKPDLGKVIATYDILNEPCGSYENQNAGTTSVCYPVFDKIYKGIRDQGDNHVITIEGVWDFTNFTDPKTYGWENIQYEIHMYNWNASSVPNWMFLDYYEMKSQGHYYDVPYYVGEFTCFDNQGNWNEQFAWFEKRGYSYTLWNYKMAVAGWWTNTWSIYTEVMDLKKDQNQLKVNLKTATYAELLDAATKTNSSSCQLSNTYKYVREYKGLA